MRNIKCKSIEGKLQEITHEYLLNKFKETHIEIRDRKDDRIKKGTFHGKVPESLLGKKVKLEHVYEKKPKKLTQVLSYKKGSSIYEIRSYIMGGAENEDFE